MDPGPQPPVPEPMPAPIPFVDNPQQLNPAIPVFNKQQARVQGINPRLITAVQLAEKLNNENVRYFGLLYRAANPLREHDPQQHYVEIQDEKYD